MKHYTVCMTIAGSDPSGGAGIQADLKTFAALGGYGQAVISALTVQSTQGVKESHPIDFRLIYDQAVEVMQDWMPHALKIGMVPNMRCADAIDRVCKMFPIPFVVYDPVMISSSGHPLIEPEAIRFIRKHLMRRCSLITPNLPEAQALTEDESRDPERLASRLSDLIDQHSVLVKGGHATGDTSVDVLYHQGKFYSYEAPRIHTRNSHGTGCVLSSAIAAYVAKGCELPLAVEKAKAFLTQALTKGAEYETGTGTGPLYLWNDGDTK